MAVWAGIGHKLAHHAQGMMLVSDVVTAIVNGDEPSGLSMRKLMAGPIPVRWDEQVGF